MPDGNAFSVTLDKDVAQTTQQPFSVTLDKDQSTQPAAAPPAAGGFSVTLDKDLPKTPVPAPPPADLSQVITDPMSGATISAPPVAAPTPAPAVPSLPAVAAPSTVDLSAIFSDPMSGAVISAPPTAPPSPPPPVTQQPDQPLPPVSEYGDVGNAWWNTQAEPPPEPIDTREGLISSLGSGVSAAFEEGRRMSAGETFVPHPVDETQRTFMGNVGYGLAHSSPVLGAGVLGAAGGTAVTGGPWGGVIGSGLAMGLTAAAQSLAPAYDQARAQNLSHEDAVNRAIETAAISGSISGLTAAVYGFAPFKSAISNILLHTFTTAPIAGTTERLAVPLATGQPLPSAQQLVEGAASDVVTGAGVSAAHAGARRLTQPREFPTITPTGAEEPGQGPAQGQLPAPEAQPQQQLLGKPELGPPPPPPPPPPEPPLPVARASPRLPTGDIPPDVPVQVSPSGQAHVVGLQTPPVEAPPVQAPPVTPPVQALSVTPPVQAPVVQTPTPQTVTTPPDDRSDLTTGGPGPAAPVGQTGAAVVQPSGEQGVTGGGGDQVPGAGDHQQAPPVEQQPQAQAPAAGAVPAEVKRPVTTEEMAALVGADNKARQALAKAERSSGTSPEKLDQLRQRAVETQDQLDRSQGPPPKPTNVFGGPNVGGDLAKQHALDLEAHQAAVDARVHAEGTEPVSTSVGADKIFAMAGQKVIRGTDTTGNPWVGTGHALVRGTSLDRAAAQTEKLKTSTSQTVDPDMLEKVVQPNPKVDYQPVTWEREVTTPEDNRVVIGTRPDGSHVTVQKPVYHALQLAAGRGGTVVAGPARSKGKSGGDDRLFARNAQGETTGVGMPVRSDQAQTRVFARGPEPAASAPAKTAAVPVDPAAQTQARLKEISDQLTALQKTKTALNGQITRARNAGKPIPQGIEHRRESVINSIAQLEREHSEITRANPVTRDLISDQADQTGASQENLQSETAVSADEDTGTSDEITPVPGPELFDQEAAPVEKATSDQAVVDQAPPEEEPVPPAGSQLANLMATRERLAGQANLSDTDNIKLQSVERQIRKLQSAQRKGRTLPVVKEDAGPAPLGVPSSRYVPKDFNYYKLNNGTSVWQSVFAAAGVDPTLAQLKPLAWQNKVLTDHLKDHFGFRDVKVMPGTNPLYARDTMLNLIRSAQDMAFALGMRPSLISLDGKLAFQIEPRGKRDYLGAYDGGTKTIHLVNDANSFGHEWIHALDHQLTDDLLNNPQLQNLLSRHTRDGELDVRDGTQAAFAKLINTLFYDAGAAALQRIKLEQQATAVDKAGNPTKGALEAQRNLDALDKGASQQRIQPSEFRKMAAQFGKPSYWASAHEMLARAGESWIARQMENSGVDPRGVVMPDEAYLNETDQRLRMTFPKDEERIAIHAAYTDLFDRLKNDGIITGPTAPKADFLPATLNWSRQVPAPIRRSTFGELVRRELQGLSAGLKQLLHPMDFLTGGDLRPSPPGTLPRATRAADMARAVVYSYGANMRIIIGRNAGPGGRALQAIYDKVAPDPGSGRLVGETFTEEHRALDNIWRNRMAAVYAKHGVPDAKSLTALEIGMLHHVMTTGDTFYPDTPFDRSRNAPGVDIPENLQRIAADLTKILNQFYRDLDTAGFKVGVAPNNYFPRMYDLQRVYSDPTGFHGAATKMYQFEFDKDVGAPGDNPVKLLEQWTQLSKAERAASDPSIPPAMKALQKNLRQQAITRQDLEANPGDPTLQAKLDALIDEARQIAEDNHELVRDHVADLTASEWTARILINDPHEFEKLGPSGRFLNARKLSPEADQIMRDYMHTDPRVAILRYIDSGTRRIAWANAFGKDESFLKGQIRKAMNAGVAGPDLSDFQSLLNRATGRMVMNTPRKFVQLSNMMHASGAAVLMGRAAWSSLAEPLNASLATGELGAGFHMLATQFSAIWDKAGAHERSEIADLFGITTSATFDSIMQARTGAEYSDSPAADRFMTQFYRTTLLTQLTNSQRTAAVGTADWLLRKWARDLQSQDKGRRADNRRDDAKRMFNELGITTQGNNLRDQFANWVLSHDGPVPLSELQTSEFRGVYGLAMRRLVDRMIQNPYKIDRPESSGLPIVSLATQLMSFNYTYQKNVLEVAFKRIHYAGQRGYKQGYDKAKEGGAGEFRARARGYATGAWDTAGALAFAAVAVSTIILGSLLTSMPRQRIYANKQWNDHVRDDDLGKWLLGVSISRSGIGGTLDPVGQVFDMFRWNSDLSSLYDGAFVGWLTRNAQNLIAPFTGKAESPDTNTQYYNQARAFYNLVFVPTEILGLTMLNASGTPGMTALTSTLLQSLTSPAAADKFAETVAGPQGSTRPKAVDEDVEDTADADVPDDKDLQMPDGKPRQRGGEAPSNVPQIPLSFLDDIAVPMVKVLEAPWKLLPGYAKVGGAGIAALLYGTHWWQETAPWRDHPNPPDKHPKKPAE